MCIILQYNVNLNLIGTIHIIITLFYWNNITLFKIQSKIKVPTTEHISGILDITSK